MSSAEVGSEAESQCRVCDTSHGACPTSSKKSVAAPKYFLHAPRPVHPSHVVLPLGGAAPAPPAQQDHRADHQQGAPPLPLRRAASHARCRIRSRCGRKSSCCSSVCPGFSLQLTRYPCTCAGAHLPRRCSKSKFLLIGPRRPRRVRQVDDREADEDHPRRRILGRGEEVLRAAHLPKHHRRHQHAAARHAGAGHCARRPRKPGICTIIYFPIRSPAQPASDEFLAQCDELETPPFDVIKQLWQDRGVQTAYARRREFQLLDSAK